MLFTVKERLMLLAMLPSKGNVTTIRLLKELTEDLSFSEKEHKKYDIKSVNGQIFWDDKKAKPKTIEIGPVMKGMIKDTLEELNEKQELQVDHLSLWEKFCKNKKGKKS